MPYKIFEYEEVYSIQKDNMSIPRSTNNRHYNMFIQDIALGNDTVEGPDVITEGYETLRAAAYPSMAEQLDMQYWDSVNGTSTWADAIQAVKDQYPTTMERTVTVGDVPAWVQEEADAWLFDKQTREYDEAVKRLAQYRLADGREEVTEERTENTQEYQKDDNGNIVNDVDGNPMYITNTYTVTIQTAIDPLPATVEQFVPDENDPMSGSMQEAPNPVIVKDDEERAAAQAVVDATPQEVIDAYKA